MNDHIDPREFFDIDEDEYKRTLVFGQPITEYNREELMAIVAHQAEQRDEMMKRHSRDLEMLAP